MINPCSRCNGNKIVVEKAKDLSGKQSNSPGYVDCYVTCDHCHGKGYISQKDIENYYKGWNLR